MRKGRRASAPFPPPRFFECETMMNNMVLFNWKKMALRRELKTNFISEFPMGKPRRDTIRKQQLSVNNEQLTVGNGIEKVT
jgi:hypothetical protein